jgi:DNA-binding NarL/FixJ family response regulator
MPEMDGITCAREIMQLKPGTSIVMLTGAVADLYCEEALHSKVRGFLNKPFGPEQLDAAIYSAVCGLCVLPNSAALAFCNEAELRRTELIEKLRLTENEVAALDGLARFLENKEIADRMGASTSAVQKYLRTAFGKLNVRTRSEAAVLWRSRS